MVLRLWKGVMRLWAPQPLTTLADKERLVPTGSILRFPIPDPQSPIPVLDMKRYISNYTILGNGDEVINHITTVGDNGQLISILPFDRELGNTVYVPEPLCVTASSEVERVAKAFEDSASRQQLKQLLAALNSPRAQKGETVAVLRLNFAHNIISILGDRGSPL